MTMFDAPIAGANYAADTRNYPWHRPPDIVSYDAGVDYLIQKMNDPQELELVYSLLEIETQVSTVVCSILMQGISKGKFGIDLAILLAGPIARYIGILADEQGIKYNMGVSDDDRVMITPTSLKLAFGFVEGDEEGEEQETPKETEIDVPVGGLMGSPDEMTASEDEQAAMLGLTNDDEEEENVDGLA